MTADLIRAALRIEEAPAAQPRQPRDFAGPARLPDDADLLVPAGDSVKDDRHRPGAAAGA